MSINENIGFFYSVFREKEAVKFSIQSLKNIYPNSPIYLVSDGGLDFAFLENSFHNIKTILGEDTMSETFNITAGATGCDYINGNYRQEYYQNIIKKCVYTILQRIEDAINYFGDVDWIVMCDPDTLIRGKLSFPKNASILGQRINCCLPEKYQNILKINNGIPISTWGASPCVFKKDTFLKALERFRFLNKTTNLLDLLAKEFYGVFAHDVLFPTLFALIGEEEIFNPDIIECNKDPEWKLKTNPLVHSFTEYYGRDNRK